MAFPSISKILLYIFGLALLGAVLGVFLAFGPPKLYAKSSTPEFCGSCHVLQMEYEAWFHSGAHKRVACIECHLPNDNFARHLFWKSIDGMHDVIRYNTGQVSDIIKISDHNAEVVKENCLRCHAETMARVNEDRKCWTCHRQLSHRLSGSTMTR